MIEFLDLILTSVEAVVGISAGIAVISFCFRLVLELVTLAGVWGRD